MQRKLFNSASSYGGVSKFFHWVVAAFVLLMLFLGYGIGYVPDKLQRISLFNVHKLIGLTILVFMVFRLCWRWMDTQPFSVNAPGWRRFLEKTVHFSLVGFVLLMPVAGWIGTAAAGQPPRLGKMVFNLPIPQSKWLSEIAFDVHNTVAIVLIVLLSIHILATAYHYLVCRDNVFKRMWV